MADHQRRWVTALHVIGDAVLILLAFVIAYWLRYVLQWFIAVEPPYQVRLSVYVPSMALLTGIILLALWFEGGYRPTRGRLWLDEFYIVFRATIVGIAGAIVIVFLATPGYYSRLIFGYTGVLAIVLLGLKRALQVVVQAQLRKRGIGVTRVLIVGAGEMARSFMRSVVACPELGYEIIGFVDDDPANAVEIGRFNPLGTTADLPSLLASDPVDQVVVTLPWCDYQTIMEVAEQSQQAGVHVRIVPDLLQMALSRVVVENVNGLPLLGWQEPAPRIGQWLIKRSLDLTVAAVGLIVLSPLFAAIALAIRLDSPGPVIFRQRRVGRGGKLFTMAKFRSMVVDAESRVAELRDLNEATGPLFKIRNDPRLTRVGRVLRHTSIDELPQLWNVLLGEMSLIGPRPALPSEVEQYEPWHARRLDVHPGITGLWQVSGRSDLTFDEMVLLDIYYIENWSPLMDLRIILKTVPTLFLGPGAY